MSDGTRRPMSPESLCNAIEMSARSFRRILYQALNGDDVRHDLRMARRNHNELLTEAEEFVERYCGEVDDSES